MLVMVTGGGPEDRLPAATKRVDLGPEALYSPFGSQSCSGMIPSFLSPWTSHSDSVLLLGELGQLSMAI
jgi:hypothetical protein